MPDVRAILVADLHLQTSPPIARSAEPNWFAAMQRPLDEIRTLATAYGCPVLYAGDIFDRWNTGPEVINFALRCLPKGYAIPGQHDLPNHSYEEMGRSAYGVLVEADHLINIPCGVRLEVSPQVAVTGFPWGTPPATLATPRVPGVLEVALIHRFVWIKDCGYPGADVNAILSTKQLQGYHVACYGDNHKGFLVNQKNIHDPWVLNCGGLMRRKTDERAYRPGIGLLTADGTVVRHYLNTTDDKFIDITEAEEAVASTLNMSAFVDELKTLGNGDALNFTETMKRFMDKNDVRLPVRNVIMEAMG